MYKIAVEPSRARELVHRNRLRVIFPRAKPGLSDTPYLNESRFAHPSSTEYEPRSYIRI